MSRTLVRDQILADVRRRIAVGMYAPGSLMPTEQALAREFRTSRTTVSKALAVLRKAGIIDQAPRRGTTVCPLDARPAKQSVRLLYAPGALNKPEGMRIMQSMQSAISGLNHRWEMQAYASPDDLRPDALAACCAGAVFLEATGCHALLHELDQRRFPCVVANLEEQVDLTCTWVDHRRTTLAAVRLLAALGHRRIAFLTRSSDLFFYRRSLEGYRIGLDELGAPFDPDWVLTSPTSQSVNAYQATRDFLARGWHPTAIIAARDRLATGACAALSEAGLSVGRDVSVVGFDDISHGGEPPRLTTFREPTLELGRVAAEMLVERLISGWRPFEKREIEAPLVVRRSVGLCPDADAAASYPEALLRP